MSAPVLELGGWALRAPVTVGTNLLLAGQSLWLVVCLEEERGAAPSKPGPWTGFLRLLALAAALGAVKHATGPGSLHEAARIGSGLGLGAAVALACVATIRARTSSRILRRALQAVVGLGLAVLAVAVVVLPSFLVVAAGAAAGLLPVLVMEARQALGARPEAAWAAAGLATAALGGLVYLLPVGVGAWVGPTDLAHGVLLAALPLLARADRAGRRP